MQQLNLSDNLRYVCVGYVVLGLLYISDKTRAIELLDDIGIFGISVFAFVVGSLIYLVYKPTIYHHIIMPLQDCIRIYQKSENFRTYLKKQYDINTSYKAMLFWFCLKRRINEEHPYLEKESSSVHLLYMSSLISLGFFLWKCISGIHENALIVICWIVFFCIFILLTLITCICENELFNPLIIVSIIGLVIALMICIYENALIIGIHENALMISFLFGIFVIFGMSAFLYDRYIEDFEYRVLRLIPKNECDAVAEKIKNL